MTAELSPAHEARMEAFKALLAKMVEGQTTYDEREAAVADYEKMLGELAAAQAPSTISPQAQINAFGALLDRYYWLPPFSAAPHKANLIRMFEEALGSKYG